MQSSMKRINQQVGLEWAAVLCCRSRSDEGAGTQVRLGRVRVRVRSGRVGSGRVGSGRVGSGWVGLSTSSVPLNFRISRQCAVLWFCSVLLLCSV